MTSLVLQPTELAQWHDLVHEAQAACHANLDELLESYLVFLLMRSCGQPDLITKVMAMEFLEAQQNTAQQPGRLREVGDQCLLLSGLFPQLAEKRLVRVSYFVGIGRCAYDQLADCVDRKSKELYAQLAKAFIAVMDVLQAMRGLSGLPALTPIAAYDLFADTGSTVAKQTLDSFGITGTPIDGFGRKQ